MGDLRVDFPNEGSFQTLHRWLVTSLLSNRLRKILSESVPLVDVMVLPLSSLPAISKAFTPLPRKSDWSHTEVGEYR